MFTIVISEKGGAQRRETFDKNEIDLGRVQGNDVMLPKGNVSKRHARLLYKEGRFIVVDMKSTNGTYVNRRKISQATIVRDGDTIYIGDFVLRLEVGGTSGAMADGSELGSDSQGKTPARPEPNPRDAGAPIERLLSPALPHAEVPPAVPPPLPPHATAGSTSPLSPPWAAAPGPVLPAASPGLGAPMGSSAPHATMTPSAMAVLEPAPTNGVSAAAVPPPLPPAVALAAGTAVSRTRAADVRSPVLPKAGSSRRSTEQDSRPNARASSGTALVGNARAPAVARASQTSVLRWPVRGAAAAAVPAHRPLPRETPQQATWRLALTRLVDRVAKVVDLAPLALAPVVNEALSQSVEGAAYEQAQAMLREGEAPEGADAERLARDAHSQLVGLGPLGPLLDDDEVSEINVWRPDCVLAVRAGEVVLAEPPFVSEQAVERAVARLAHGASQPRGDGELVVERCLVGGAHMVAIAPPTAASWAISIRKPHRIAVTLDDVARDSGLSRAVVTFLEACLTARANMIVVGSGPEVVGTIVGALASTAAVGERVAVLQDAEEIAPPQGQVVSLAVGDHDGRGEECVRAACRLGPDRLVVASLAGAVGPAVVEAIGEGVEGVVAGINAPSLRQAMARLASRIALAHPGAAIEAAREALGESFDVAIEVVRAADGAVRVLRVAEVAGAGGEGVVTRDLFVLSADATGESAYASTGRVPRLIDDFAARGIDVDAAVFQKR